MEIPYTFFGMEASLYSARPRAYMRKNAVPFVEKAPGDPEFGGKIIPAIGRMIIPVIKTAEGTIIQDGADIIDHLDASGFSKTPLYPNDPVLRILAHVFELFGSHGLLRPAMHYRWSFDDQNLNFITDAFGDLFPAALPAEAKKKMFLGASGSMRKAALAVGVVPETMEEIEKSYTRFLSLLNDHLEVNPYILGGHPTLADYGLIGAMYAHLGRDPAPLHLMQTQAPRVHRWTERMNTAEVSEDKTQGAFGHALIGEGSIPETLSRILHFIAEDYLPEITAHVEYANNWLDQNPEVTAGTSTAEELMKPSIGMAGFTWRGIPLHTVVLPYRFYLLTRLQDAFAAQTKEEQSAVRAMLTAAGLETLLDIRTHRRMERVGNQEAWGELNSTSAT